MASKRSILRKVKLGNMTPPDWFDGVYGADTPESETSSLSQEIVPEPEPIIEEEIPMVVSPPPYEAPIEEEPTEEPTAEEEPPIEEPLAAQPHSGMLKSKLVDLALVAGHDVSGLTKRQILDLLTD